MRKLIAIVSILAITLFVGLAEDRDWISDAGDNDDYFDYGTSATDTSELIYLGDYDYIYIDIYAKLQTSTGCSLEVDLLGQYEANGTWLEMHDYGTTLDSVTATTYKRIMIRSVDDTTYFTQPYVKIRSKATITGDSACVWYVVGKY